MKRICREIKLKSFTFRCVSKIQSLLANASHPALDLGLADLEYFVEDLQDLGKIQRLIISLAHRPQDVLRRYKPVMPIS